MMCYARNKMFTFTQCVGVLVPLIGITDWFIQLHYVCKLYVSISFPFF